MKHIKLFYIGSNGIHHHITTETTPQLNVKYLNGKFIAFMDYLPIANSSDNYMQLICNDNIMFDNTEVLNAK